MREGTLDPVEVTREHLQRITAFDGELHAFTAVRTEAALADAAETSASRERTALPLAGVPVAVKDNMDVAGLPTRQGSPGTPATPASADSEVVRRLRAAGAVIVGKTAMSELAIWPFTEAHGAVTRNPIEQSRTCGGSSGGSAVAVAAGMAALGLGSDSGGSIRIPAACCGLAGVKPTPRLVPLPGGAAKHWYGLTAVGPLARDVADASLMFGVLRGVDERVPQRASEGALRVTVSVRHPMLGAPVDSTVAAAVRRVATVLSEAGHRVEDDDPPYPLLPLPFLRCYLAGIADDADTLSLDVDATEPRTRVMIQRGRWIRRLASDTEAQAVTAARRLRQWVKARDVLLTPALAYPPPEVGRWANHGWFSTTLGVARWMGFSPPWNLAGCPAAVVPVGDAADGMPVAVQLVTAVGRDGLLLDVAAQVEALAGGRR